MIVQAQKRLKDTRLLLWRRNAKRVERKDDERKEPKVKPGSGSQGQEMKCVYQHSKVAEIKKEGQVRRCAAALRKERTRFNRKQLLQCMHTFKAADILLYDTFGKHMLYVHMKWTVLDMF